MTTRLILAVLPYAFYMVPVQAAKESTCVPRFAGKSMASIDFGDRAVHLVGWDHPDAEDGERLRLAAQAALGAVTASRCGKAVHILDRALERSRSGARRAAGVVSTLESLNRVTPLRAIGREISPEEWEILYADFGRFETAFGVTAGCGSRAAASLGEIRKVLYGPDMTYLATHPEASIFPYESQSLRDENGKAFSEVTRVDFDDESTSLSKTASFKTVAESIWAERPIEARAIENLASELGGPRASAEARVREDVAIWRRRVRGAYLRNDAIVANVSRVRLPTALVIGHRHVRDLVEKLEAQCRREASAVAR